VEKRTVTELALAGAAAELAAGLAIGGGLASAVIATLWLAGCYRVVDVNAPSVIIPALATAAMTGTIEEIFLRGIAFRLSEQAFALWWAFLLTAALFGALHGRNPHATLTSTIAIACSGGLVLGAAFVLTRRLWLAIGIHVAWNLLQSGIFGVPVSGKRVRGWLQGELRGPALVSGGPFGIEGSIVVAVLGLALTAALLAAAAGGRQVYAF
jgi:membrane protease YdiL (CAAX protease family)